MKNYAAGLMCLLLSSASFPQTFTQSDLPLILIDTQGKNIPDDPKITALMKVINNDNKVNKVTDTNYEYDGYIGIEIRGNTSQIFFDKKSFSIETRTDSGTNRNVSLLGLPEENDWVLYGPYSDKTMIRNVLAYHLGNTQGRWSPRTRYCEVFINNEYRGVYVLTEKIKIDKNRVDIAKLLPVDNAGDELTGGYIMRIDRDRYGSWNSPFMGRTGNVDVPISYLDPPYDELTAQQRSYIRDYITDFEYALHDDDFKNPEAGYRPYVNVLSWVDYFLITELTRDLDGYRCSVYFHKDKDSKGGKLVMSPLWDYNLGFGNGNFMEADNPFGWTADGIGKGDWYEIPFWWDKLREDPYFNSVIKRRWEELRSKSFSNLSINEFIDSCSNVLMQSQQRNYQKFDILNKFVWPNAYIGGSYFSEVNYLKDWIADRLDWLDDQFNSIIPLSSGEVINHSTAAENHIIVYPNPFAERVTLRISLSEDAEAEILIHNMLGSEIAHLSMVCHAGSNEISFSENVFTNRGNLFFYTLKVDGKIFQTGKLIRY